MKNCKSFSFKITCHGDKFFICAQALFAAKKYKFSLPVSASLRWNSSNNATKNEPNELWVPRIKNWTMKDEKHTTHDQHESTLRSSCTRSAFPSIRSPSQLCSWLTHSRRTAKMVGRKFRPFSVDSTRFLTKLPSKLPLRNAVWSVPANDCRFKV